MKLSILQQKIAKISQDPGVYVFKDKAGNILYVGKAANLRSRVGSYFPLSPSPSPGGRGGNFLRPIEAMMHEIADVKVQETDSVLEALILEANLIKSLQPKYNAMGKDDKSFVYAVITKEEFPRVVVLRETELSDKGVIASEAKQSRLENHKIRLPQRYAPRNDSVSAGRVFGPYTSKKQLEIALKIIRRIFPYHSSNQKTEKGCLDFQMGRCPGPYAGGITRENYLKNIRGIRMILEGKKKSLVKKMKKEMKETAKNKEFEKAAELRNKIFSLQHIGDVALMSNDANHRAWNTEHELRIEAYDISDISGDHAVGSMVVFKNSEPDKSQYRKFRIKTVKGANDVGMMREVLLRRLKNDWPQPDLIFLDGGRGHLNMAEKLFKELGMKIPIVAVAKGAKRKNLELRISNLELESGIKNIVKDKKLVKRIMDEAHRFAIGYHKKLRRRNMVG